MRFGPPSRTSTRRGGQDRSVVPMINVVFLLLIFFLMTASLAPPPPLDITAPIAEAERTEPRSGTLFIDAEGRMSFNWVEGPEVLSAIRADAPAPLPVLADASYPAADLARLLPTLAAHGVNEIFLRTLQP